LRTISEVAGDPDRRHGFDVDRDRDTPKGGGITHPLRLVGGERVEPDLSVHLAARLEAGQVEQVRDDARHPDGFALQLFGEAARRGRVVDRPVAKGLRRGPDRGHRRLQLVRGVRDEVPPDRRETAGLGHVPDHEQDRPLGVHGQRGGPEPPAREPTSTSARDTLAEVLRGLHRPLQTQRVQVDRALGDRAQQVGQRPVRVDARARGSRNRTPSSIESRSRPARPRGVRVTLHLDEVRGRPVHPALGIGQRAPNRSSLDQPGPESPDDDTDHQPTHELRHRARV
jgi:hypothetical protein